jgi:hypothetical protein
MGWTEANVLKQIRSMISNIQSPADLNFWLDGLERTLKPGEEPLLKVSKFIRTACSLFEFAMPLVLDAKAGQLCKVYPDFMQKLREAEALCPDICQNTLNATQWHFWSSWSTCKIKLSYVIILMSSLVEHVPNSPFDPEDLAWQRNACRDDTARRAAEIIRSLPMSLGGSAPDAILDLPSAGSLGLRLVWPLTAMYLLPTVPTLLRAAARNALLKVGTDTGVLQALRGYTRRKQYSTESTSDIKLDKTVPTDGYVPDVCSPASWDPSEGANSSPE